MVAKILVAVHDDRQQRLSVTLGTVNGMSPVPAARESPNPMIAVGAIALTPLPDTTAITHDSPAMIPVMVVLFILALPYVL